MYPHAGAPESPSHLIVTVAANRLTGELYVDALGAATHADSSQYNHAWKDLTGRLCINRHSISLAVSYG